MTSSFQKVFHLFDGGIAAVTLLMLYATLWCNIIGSSSAYECIHDTFVAEKELNGLTLDVPSQDTRNDLRNLQSGLTYSNFDSIRIAFLTDGLSTFKSSAPSDFALFTERILPAVAKKLSSTFRVRRILSGLGLRRPCTTLGFLTAPNGLSVRACAVADANNVGTCIVSPIPQGLYSEDIFVCNDASLTNCTFRKGNAGLQSADFTVLVNVDTSATCSGHSTALAFAGICFRDSNTDRPLISELTFCNSAINSMRRDPRTGVDTLLHEVLHGLGFSVSYYPRFRFDNGTARTARSASGRPLASNTTVLDGVVVGPRSQINNYLVTETAREYARSYFGCAGTRGISLEAQGGGGSAGSHVEQTSFFEDTMVAIGGTDTVLTNATLTILRDSGWYNIEFDQAGNPQWGRNGFSINSCALGDSLCNNAGGTTDENSFCFASQKHCSYDLTTVTECGIYSYTNPLPASFQYFSNPRVGGGAPFLNFCPIRDITRDNCTKSSLDANNSQGNIHGPQSRCFESTSSQSSISSGSFRCHETECVSPSPFSGIYTAVKIKARAGPNTTEEVMCTPADELTRKPFPTLQGTVKCPNVEKMCWNQPCHNKGTPRNKMCVCASGFIGSLCTLPDNADNRLTTVHDFSYGDLSRVTLLRDGSFLFPAYYGGPAVSFAEIDSLPAGLKLNMRTGEIDGVPTTVSSCQPYTLSVKSNNGEEARTVIYIAVVNEVPSSVDVRSSCGKFLYEFKVNRSTVGLSGNAKIYMDAVYSVWNNTFDDPSTSDFQFSYQGSSLGNFTR